MDFDLTNGTAVLERTPYTLRAMLAGLQPFWIDATEGAETWSPYVIVGHLIHGERTDWIPRARIILARGQTGASRPTLASPRSATAKAGHWASCSTSLPAFGRRTSRRSHDGA